MKRIEHLPAAFARYRAVGGMLQFGVFEADRSDRPTLAEAMRATMFAPDEPHRFDPELLWSLGYRTINRRAMLGDWHDPASGNLIRRGGWTMRDGRELIDPPFKAANGSDIVSGGGAIPAAGSGGQLAFAFACPPYTLLTTGAEVQRLFDTIMDYILPRKVRAEIRDWSSPQLPRVSDRFEPGMEWWGVFLFSIYVPEWRRLTIIAGATSD